MLEILPLVEFTLEEGISDMEAIRLIDTPPEASDPYEGWTQEITEKQQTLKLDRGVRDPFAHRLINFEVFIYDIWTILEHLHYLILFQAGDSNFLPVIVNRNDLLYLDSASVLICKWNPPLKYQYFRNLLPDLQITLCYSCHKVIFLNI